MSEAPETGGTAEQTPDIAEGTVENAPTDAEGTRPADRHATSQDINAQETGAPEPGAQGDDIDIDGDDDIDVSSPAKVMRIGTMVKQLLEEVRSTDLDEKGRERLAKIHRKSIEELEDGLSKDLIDELERLDLPFDSADGPPTNSELRIAQAQLVGWLEGLFHGIQTAIMAQQAMAKAEFAARGQLPPGMVHPGAQQQAPNQPSPAGQGPSENDDSTGTGNYL